MNRIVMLTSLCLIPAAAVAQDATARLMGPDGAEHGTVEFHSAPEGIVVRVVAVNLDEGAHGFHLHEMGACSPDFEAAGGHFAPDGNEHGFLNEAGPHAGDLPMIHVDSDGNAMADFYTRLTSLEELMDDDGAAVIVHSEPDTYMDPSSTGDRVACGVIEGM